MNLKELFEMQKRLDEYIIKEKGLEGQDLLSKKVLALQVELGELSNEWRGFKFWSNNQAPGEWKQCPVCLDQPGCLEIAIKNEIITVECPICKGYEEVYVGNKMLEEYVDCLHFFLSIANTLKLPENKLCTYDDMLEGSTTKGFIEIIYHVGLIELEECREDQIYNFRTAFFIFANMAEQRLNFEWEQIVQAYKEKNKVNHERQENGY